MNILFVSAVLPYPLLSGGQVRMYNLLKRLSSKHQITLLSFLRDSEEIVNKKEFTYLRNVITYTRGHARQWRYLFRAVTSSYPWLWATYDNGVMRKGIETLMSHEKFDLIHIEPGYVWPSIPATKTPIVTSEHNIEHKVYEGYIRQFPLPFLRPLLYVDVLKMKYWEKQSWQKAAKIVTVSDHDRDVIGSIVPGANISVVQNGVDTQEFVFHLRSISSNKLKCLYVGDFRWFPNVDGAKWLLSEIWPQVKKALPSAELTIVGRQVPDFIRIQARNLSVTIKESVPSIAEEYTAANVLIAPIRMGGGTKFKILEAMANGLPVVTTKHGIQGLLFEQNTHVLVANTAKEYVSAIRGLLKNKNTYQQQTKNARTAIEAYYSWDVIAGLLDKAWKETYESDR